MAQITMKALLETGVHFGHRTRKWNPKMGPYIFTERNGIHILDLQQTLQALKEAYVLVRDTVYDGGTIMFVGTKRQAQETIAREAQRCGMPYVNERWLGGTLTNWRTIRERINYLKDLERRRDEGEFELLTKKEALTLTREIEKLNIRLGGIREMGGLPDLLFVVDVNREYTAVHEANILEIPVIALVDTNCDPELIDYVIPSNDDAIRAIKLITGVMADAVLEGKAMRTEGLVEEIRAADEAEEYDYDYDEEEGDEAFLGEATLDKLKSGELSFEEEAGKKDRKASTEATEGDEDEEAEEIEEAEEAETDEEAEEADEADDVDDGAEADNDEDEENNDE